MQQLLVITSRNLKQYLRDKGAVFFSLLSMMIIIVLMLFFLGDVTTSSITDIFAQFPGRDTVNDEKNAELLILVWTCAGMVSINAVTVTQASLSYMIRDRASGKLNSIYTAPVSRGLIACGNVLAAWIASVIICAATLVICEVYCVIQGLAPFSALAHLKLLGMIAVNSFTYATLMYLVATLVKSEGAWGGLSTIVGTLVGFLGGIYCSIGSMSDTIAGIMKCTPVIYGTAMFRREMMAGVEAEAFAGLPDEVVTQFDLVMGNALTLGSHTLTVAEELGILLACGTVFLLIGAAVLRFGRKADR